MPVGQLGAERSIGSELTMGPMRWLMVTEALELSGFDFAAVDHTTMIKNPVQRA